MKREYPPRPQFERDIARIVDRGARLLFVFSGESGYLYGGQFWDWLERKDWGGRVEVEHYPKADHTFMFQAAREMMLARVAGWIRDAIAVTSGAAPRVDRRADGPRAHLAR